MKKLLNLFLLLCLLLSLAMPAFGSELEDAETSGTCGEEMVWEYADGVLTVEGSGYMDDFEESAPWAAFQDEIKRVELKGSIEYIGAHAFTDYDALETVNFGGALYEIGAEAFKSCDGLTVIYLPATFKVFGESSLSSCSNLTSIHCSGRFPSFRMNCLWNTFGKIYYPAEKPWGTEYIAQLEEAFKGRIEFLASDGTDHYQPDGEAVTEAPTQAPTEEPTQPPTAAPTQAPEPTAAPTEILETVPVTAPQTEPEATFHRETEPAPAAQPESKSWIGLVIIGAVAAFVLLGIIVTLAGSRRGRYSKRRRKR